MVKVWWINQTSDYHKESHAGLIYAGFSKHHARKRTRKVKPRDITVHYSGDGEIPAIGLVTSHVERKKPPFREEKGWVAEVEYHEFPQPLDLQELAPLIQDRTEDKVPLDDRGYPHEGYCWYFNHEALAVIRNAVTRDHANSWPPWPQARFPAQTQIAVDSEDREERGEDSSSPEKRDYEISRVVRDSRLARQVKKKADYQCQVCGTEPIELPDETVYAEAHHLHPLSEGGPDNEENIICVCPTCHVKLDYHAQELEVDALNTRSDSEVTRKYVEYHNGRV